MQRVIVMGCAGSGKSTLAKRMSAKLDIPVHHLDVHYWAPGWTKRSDTEFEKRVKAITQTSEWIIDGNYSRISGGRFETGDTLVFLDFPRWLCLFRVLKRTLLNHGRSREDTGEDNPERFNLPFLLWVWNWKNHSRPNILALAEACPDLAFVRLTSRRDVARFLENL